MTVKEILDGFGLPDEYQPTIQLIDFEKLENFVSLLVDSLIAKFKKERVKLEIDMDNPNSAVCGLLTHIIEVGGIKIISDNHLETNDSEKLQISVIVVSFALNFSLAKELRARNLYDLDSYNYYNLDALGIIIERLLKHVQSGEPQSHARFEFFANEMVKTNLFNKL
jgi:hypothetical protein